MSPTVGSSGGGRSTCLSFQRSEPLSLSFSQRGLAERLRDLQRDERPLPRSRERDLDRERRCLLLSRSHSRSRSRSRSRLRLLLLRLLLPLSSCLSENRTKNENRRSWMKTITRTYNTNRILKFDRSWWYEMERNGYRVSIVNRTASLRCWPVFAWLGVTAAYTRHKHLQLFHGIRSNLDIILIQHGL